MQYEPRIFAKVRTSSRGESYEKNNNNACVALGKRLEKLKKERIAACTVRYRTVAKVFGRGLEGNVDEASSVGILLYVGSTARSRARNHSNRRRILTVYRRRMRAPACACAFQRFFCGCGCCVCGANVKKYSTLRNNLQLQRQR